MRVAGRGRWISGVGMVTLEGDSSNIQSSGLASINTSETFAEKTYQHATQSRPEVKHKSL